MNLKYILNPPPPPPPPPPPRFSKLYIFVNAYISLGLQQQHAVECRYNLINN